MNIFCLSYWDNGGQLQWLAEALRKYTEHDILHLSVQRTFLDYPCDLYYPDYKERTTGLLELKQRISGYDDFFIFSEFLPDDLPIRPILEELGIYNKITKNNTVIRTGGSIPRNNPEHYLFAQLRKGWVYTGAYYDYSIASQIGCVAFTKNICPIDKIPKPNPPKDKLRVTFAPTKKEKGAIEFSRVMDTLTKEYDIEATPIIKKSWKESIKIKSEANITFDQFLIPTYANSAIESMYLSHAVLSKIDLWTEMLFPDLPVIIVDTERDLYEAIKWLIENPKEMKIAGKKGKEFVLKHHHPKIIAEQWIKLMAHVIET